MPAFPFVGYLHVMDRKALPAAARRIPKEPCSRPGEFVRSPLAEPPSATGPLTDPFGRRITYLRLSITESCNFRCTYCHPAEEAGVATLPPAMTGAEIVRLGSLFVGLGATKIRLTGGEPTLHPELVPIAEGLCALAPSPELALSTNGVLLPRLAPRLREAGVTRVNVSLDAVSRERFRQMTGRDRFDAVRAGIDAALGAGFLRVKINAVVLRDVNEDQIVPLASLARSLPVDVRFIELMPLSGNGFRPGDQVTTAEVEKRLGAELELTEVVRETNAGPARMFHVAGFEGRVGFISPFSLGFCGDCNRVRVTARGALRLCLLGGGEADLVGRIRSGADDAALARTVRDALAGKAERHPLVDPSTAMPSCGTPMWAIGG